MTIKAAETQNQCTHSKQDESSESTHSAVFQQGMITLEWCMHVDNPRINNAKI